MENITLGNVLGSPPFLNIKLQSMHSGGFQNHPHEASAQDYNACPTSFSISDMHLQYDVMPITEQALQHIISHNPLLPVSSSMSPQLLTAAEDAALVNQFQLAHGESVSLPYTSCKKEGREQHAELAAGLVSSSPTCASFLGPHHSALPHSYASSMVQYDVSQGFGASSGLSNSGNELAQKLVSDDPNGCLIDSDNFSFLTDHACCASRDYMSCLMASDGQESRTACSLDGAAGNYHMAALSTSSSSSTPSSISSGLTQLTKENLQAWTVALDSSAHINHVRDLYDVHDRKGALNDIHLKNEGGVVQHMIVNDNKSAISLIVGGGASAAAPGVAIQKKSMKRRKRKRMPHKNVEEMETQRMTHIAVERNRRKQMNEHLRALRLLMPPSYIQRGDQASIVGGTIRFVEELEQIIQSLRLQKQLQAHHTDNCGAHIQQYHEQHVEDTYASTRSCMANVEVTMLTSSTMFMKVLAQKKPHQLFHTLSALSNLCLRVTHLNITTIGLIIVYTFNLEMDCDSQQRLTPFRLAESIQHTFVNEIEANGSMYQRLSI